jgi:hypothetical protein
VIQLEVIGHYFDKRAIERNSKQTGLEMLFVSLKIDRKRFERGGTDQGGFLEKQWMKDEM